MKKSPESRASAYGAHTKERAKFWGVSVRVMQKMLTARPPWPVDDVPAMLRRVASMPAASQRKLTKSFRRRVDEIRVAQAQNPSGAPGAATTPGHIPTDSLADPDYAEFLRTHAQTPSRDGDILAALKTRRAFAAYKLELAQSRGDLAAVKDATEQLRYISGVIYDEETLAQKLGREIGDQLPRAEVERLARALAYWSLRCTDEILVATCKPLADASASGPLFPEEVRTLLEPVLLSARVFTPLVRALKSPTALALPAWLVDAHRAALADVIEDADRAFAQLYAAPLPVPPKETSTDSVTKTP